MNGITAITAAVPDHVPAHMVRDFDMYLSGPSDRVFRTWKALQNEGTPDIFWTPRNGGHWVATRGADIEEIHKNHDLFTSTRGNALPFREVPSPPQPIWSDPPEHGQYRRLIAPFFFPKRVALVETHARTLARTVVDSIIDEGGCEFSEDFSNQMPVHAFLGLVGLPATDWHRLKHWSAISHQSDVAAMQAATKEAFGYLKECIDARRLNPGDDPLTALVQGEIFGRKLTEEECLGGALTVLFAGLNTTRAAMNFIAHYLATHGDQRRRLAENPSLIPAAVEEFLRRFPTSVLGRSAKHDLVYKGVTMKAGDPILLAGVLGNFDDRRFANPLTVDFARKDLGKSLTFGAGAHRCAGSMLARMEIRVFLEEWLSRIPDFRVAEEEEPVVHCGTTITLVNLHLRW